MDSNSAGDDISIHLLTAIGLTPSGSSTAHIYTQKIHSTTQLTQTIPRTTQLTQTIYKKVKQSHYRPGVTQRVPGS